jgi:hypothetical protein
MLKFDIGKGKQPYIECFFLVGEVTNQDSFLNAINLYKQYTSITNINLLYRFYPIINNFKLGEFDKLKALTSFASNSPNFLSACIVAETNTSYRWEYGKDVTPYSYHREKFYYMLNLTDGIIRLKILDKKKDNQDILKLKFYYKYTPDYDLY